MAKKKAKIESEVTAPPVVVDWKDLPEAQVNELLAGAEWGSEFTDALLAMSAKQFSVRGVQDFAELVFNVRLAKHHLKWVEEVLNNKRVAIVAPPESAKTTVSIVLIAFWIGHFPHTTNLVASAGDSLAMSIAQTIAHVIEFSPKWKKVFPNVVPNKDKGWSREGWEVVDTAVPPAEWEKLTATKKDPTLLAGGVGSATINGRRVTGILLADDLHDRKSKESDTICQQTVDFVKDTLLRRATTSAHVVFNQTRWNPNDVVGWLGSIAESEYAVKIFVHPALNEDGASYWPKNWPIERLNAERDGMTEAEWQLVFMGNAEAARGTVLKKEALIAFPFLSLKADMPHYIGVDFAQKLQELNAKDAAKHSEFAIAVLTFTGNCLVLEDGLAELYYSSEAENAFFDFCERYHPVRATIEINAQNKRFYNEMVARKLERGMHWLVMNKSWSSTDVGIRITAIEPHFRNGSIQVSDRPLPFLKKFNDQWLGLGTKGKKNDTLSAVELAYQAAYNIVKRETPEQERARKAKPAVSIGRLIEQAYGVR